MMNQGDVTGSGRHSLDIWHVRLANGETRSLSLDDLDAAFQAGWVDERTPVLAAGAIRWAPLSEVAGLDAPAPVSSMPNSIAPLALDNFAPDAPAIPFDLDVPIDAASDAEVQAFRPRRGRTVFRVLTAMVVVAGLGFAAFRAKPAVQRALASRGGGHAAPVTVVAAEAKPAAAPAPAAPAAPAPSPAAVTSAIPTMTATALPDAAATPQEKKAAAEAEKKAAAEARKAKRAGQKRK